MNIQITPTNIWNYVRVETTLEKVIEEKKYGKLYFKLKLLGSVRFYIVAVIFSISVAAMTATTDISA